MPLSTERANGDGLNVAILLTIRARSQSAKKKICGVLVSVRRKLPRVGPQRSNLVESGARRMNVLYRGFGVASRIGVERGP
jgi:hypothetical protein